jgi:PKD repeat protein
VRVGAPATLTGQLVDADPSQVLSLTVIWGDGSVPDQSTPDRDPFAVTHTYASPGVYTVHVIWSDSHGVSNSRDLTITVRPARHGEHGDHDSHTDDLDAFFAALAGALEDRHHRK